MLLRKSVKLLTLRMAFEMENTLTVKKFSSASLRFATYKEAKSILFAFMPFSTEITADVYLPHIRRALKDKIEAITEKEVYIDLFSLLDFEKLKRLAEEKEDVLNGLEKLNDDSELAMICVHGKYRKTSTLKSLCRATIRAVLLGSNRKSYGKFIENIRSLKVSKARNERFLPVQVQNFLLFK